MLARYHLLRKFFLSLLHLFEELLYDSLLVADLALLGADSFVLFLHLLNYLIRTKISLRYFLVQFAEVFLSNSCTVVKSGYFARGTSFLIEII